MTTEPYFSEEHKRELSGIFTRLADFIHEHGLAQVVSVGPSAAPYAKHIARAYQNRHGGRIRVVNLGRIGEEIARSKSKHKFKILLKAKPNFNLRARSLLFDEVSMTNETICGASSSFRELGLSHKTAVLVRDSTFASSNDPDFVGAHELGRNSKSLPVIVGFGITHKLFYRIRSKAHKVFLRQLHSELREIADSVPRKEQAQRERK